MTKNEIIQRIERQYVGDDCLQVMVPYKDALTLVGDKGILFHYKDGSSHYINDYLQDERRFEFPYSNIPTHYSRYHVFGRIGYTNQIFDFEKPYLKIGNGTIIESFAVKDNREALLINRVTPITKTTTYKTRDELMSMFTSKNDGGRNYFIYSGGGMNLNPPEKVILSEEQIESELKELLSINVEEFENYKDREPDSMVGEYIIRNPQFLQFVSQSIEQMDLSKYTFNILVGEREPLYIVSTGNGEIKIKGVKVYFICPNKYRVEEYNVPVTKYTLEQLKYAAQIQTTKEPRIPLILNPGVSRQDIEEAKKLVKARK